MKHILIILLALIVSAAAHAQTKKATTVKPEIKSQQNSTFPVNDTTYAIMLNRTQLNALLQTLQTTYSILPRSADLSALQASEGQKQVAALGKILMDQLPKLLMQSDTISKNK